MPNKRARSNDCGDNTDISITLEQLEKSKLNVVVSRFNNKAYIHIRKYFNGNPTQYGVHFEHEDWKDFIAFVNDPTRQYELFTKCEGKKIKNGTLVMSSLTAEMDLYIKKEAIVELKKRYVMVNVQ